MAHTVPKPTSNNGSPTQLKHKLKKQSHCSIIFVLGVDQKKCKKTTTVISF